MFKLKIYFISILNSMGLSKRNLGKLNTFIKKNNLVCSNNSNKNYQEPNNSSKIDDHPSEIFYSIIDNSNDINETSEENLFLKNSEDSFHNVNSRKTSDSMNLSIEEELYDEFNYLLDE